MPAVRYVDPIKELGGLLLNVEKPERYTGGEFGRLAANKKLSDNDLCAIIAFPDLYEIGMGNHAVRIIYNHMNRENNLFCDRAFAPAPDFEKLLREKNIPIYGLDTGISAASVDLLMFTLGYELGLNGILTILDVSNIPLHCEKRNSTHPIVIAGGPAVSNPLPYSPFIDAFWIGEAEDNFFDLASELSVLKKRGQGRAGLLEKIASHPNVWVKGKKNARRAIATGFSQSAYVFPVPSMKITHHHGTVEIMRGCPNGCRFCHAGYWYRPYRQKEEELIACQVNEMVTKGGWQEISLSSLSSGDYEGITELVENLNERFRGLHVSFQLPSLKVSGFSLSILEQIAVTRKSGLTFAVETPKEAWQEAINKEVTKDSVVSIIQEAKKNGWKGAKFYFMIGLPVPVFDKKEEEEIVSFIADIGRRTRMHFNINVGIFIPKPHTPYQWATQLDSETAIEKLNFIRSKLKPLGHKVSISDALISQIEGLLSRGDERAGLLCEQAWSAGSRLDPWSEFINKTEWRRVLEDNRSVVDSILSGKNKPFPWENIDSHITPEYIRQEFEKSENSLSTSSCKEKCNNCGVSSKIAPCPPKKLENQISKPYSFVNRKNTEVNDNSLHKTDPSIYRVLFSFSKEGSAVFHGHLSLIEIFSLSFRRAGISVMYTKGFNPLIKMEFASPLSIGVSADCEIAAVDFTEEIPMEHFVTDLNSSLPHGFSIKKAESFLIKSGMKKHSLSSLLWGFEYAHNDGVDYVNQKEEKVYRQNRINKGETLFSLKRNEVLARNITNENANQWIPYFNAYRFLYPN
ncbi:TIGR03936 family radical SAM-associated protein [Treponema sp. R80B11-R83G3]